MTTFRFHLTSALTPTEVVGVLTDFGPLRPRRWPASESYRFVVHDRGPTWAEVTEGTETCWESVRYDWDPEGTVIVTTLDSQLFGSGGGWIFRALPENGGSRVEIELTRTRHSARRRVLAALLTAIAPFALRSSGPDLALAG